MKKYVWIVQDGDPAAALHTFGSLAEVKTYLIESLNLKPGDLDNKSEYELEVFMGLHCMRLEEDEVEFLDPEPTPAIKYDIPHIRDLWEFIAVEDQPDEKDFVATVRDRICMMLQYAQGAIKPSFYMSPGEKGDTFYKFYYCLSDLQVPYDPSQVNWFGNNHSQAICNGAIVVEDKKIRVHT